MYSQEQPRRISKDIFLIMIGALISFSTTFITLLYSNKIAGTKEEFTRRNLFIEDLANNSGKRWFILRTLYVADSLKQPGNSADEKKIAIYLSKLDSIQAVWNARHLSYFPLLKIYFGNSYAARFDDKIYEPLIGCSATLKDPKYDPKKNTNLSKKLGDLSSDMDRFFYDLYDYNNQTYNPNK